MAHGADGRASSLAVVKRVKMGKKVERALRERIAQNQEDDGDKSPEPYQCVGNFQSDFTELCKQNNMARPPSLQIRPRRPQSPSQQVLLEVSQHATTKKGRDDKKAQLQAAAAEEEETAEEKELIALFGFKPKSFVARETSEYMRPAVQVELEQPDKYDTVTDIYVRGWRVEQAMLDSFRQCFVKLARLQTLHFWRAAFTEERIRELSEALSQCEHIKTLIMDANEPLEEENYHELIKENSYLTKLQLRHCAISAAGCRRIADQLGNTKSANAKLLSLDLSSNKVGDEGALAIAKALRTNRTLLHLALSNNGISDVGCCAIAQSLSQFVLTHEEIVSRRYLLSEKESAERPKSVSTARRRSSQTSIGLQVHRLSLTRGLQPPLSRRDQKDQRPGSVRSQEKGRSSRTDKKGKGKDAKEEKVEKGKGKKEDKAAGKKAAASVDAAKSAAKTKAKGGKTGKAAATLEVVEPVADSSEVKNPLLERAETIGPGQLQIPGNFVLILLNLSRNTITELGLEALLRAVNIQASIPSRTKPNGTGLMKVLLKGNAIGDELLLKHFEEAMLSRDPFYKAPPKTPDTDSHVS